MLKRLSCSSSFLCSSTKPRSRRQFLLITRIKAPTSSIHTMSDAVEAAKKKAGQRAVEDHFDDNASYVGIGSGTTIVYVVDAIKERSINPHMQFVPTGYQSQQVIVQAGLKPIAYDALPEDAILDVAFDGADEVDEELNCIKGGGACLFQEKLVAERAKKFVCVADYRKDQSRLLTNWPSIPIEVAPISVNTVLQTLRTIGSKDPKVRQGKLEKAGPLKTDQDFFIIDAPFPSLLTQSDVSESKEDGKGPEGADDVPFGSRGESKTKGDGKWEVQTLATRIKSITGVLEVGIFSGLDGKQAQAMGLRGGQRPVAVYFGMQDGSVKVRHAKGSKQ